MIECCEARWDERSLNECPRCGETLTAKSPASVCYSDFVTCPVCQADLDGARSEYDTEDDWPDWLQSGFCSTDCFSCSG